ncbi:iron(III) transport system ATP-binding protein [Arthrobacter sp. GAS37]|uniref:ABC transporter ATP-binding protein n=1 Tax=Arthrobacter sp. GAS37 TaxID=3156261 RepID=UPI003832ADE8
MITTVFGRNSPRTAVSPANPDGPAEHPGMSGGLIEVKGAAKSYGSTPALTGVDLRIEPGRFAVLLGPSGSGKSTLLRSIAGIERLNSGSISLNGTTVSSASMNVPPERRDLGMVFQDYALWPHMTVAQNVGYALRRRKLRSAAATRLITEMLERVGLTGKASSYPPELSGGQQQRVSLARALVGRPSLILFDEPLSNLDADLRERLRLEISTLTRETGASALYITHDQSEAFALADEIGVLREGTLEQYGRPEEIYNNPATPFVARFTGVGGTLAGIVTQGHGDRVTVRLGDSEVYCRRAGNLKPGDEAIVQVRPAATRLSLPEHSRPGQAPNHASLPGSAGTLAGRVLDVAYRGRTYDHVVEGPWGRLTSVSAPAGLPRGADCLVTVDPEAAIAFGTTPGAH